MSHIIKAPENILLARKKDHISVFLAGSIEMGKAVEWQTDMCIKLLDKNIVILNPRRTDWDSSWEQKIDNEQFYEQVNWELDAMEHADFILMYFDPATKSPISLLELGLFAHTGKLIVFCPDGFWRKGNVDIVCEQYEIRQIESFDEAVELLTQAALYKLNETN